MVAKLKQVGNEYLLVLPPEAVGQLAPQGPHDQMEVDLAVQDGSVVLRPASGLHSERVKQIAEKVMSDYDSALKRLAE